jgi:hypothetical protein
VEVHHANSEAFCSSIGGVFARFPVRAVRLAGHSAVVLRLLDRPAYLARLSQLDVRDFVAGEVPAQHFMDRLLQASPRRLRSLLLEADDCSSDWDENLLRLTEPGPLNGLTELGLALGTRNNPPSSPVLTALATSANLAGLVKFHIPFSQFNLPVARHLASSPTLARLTHLDLGCAEISAPGWRRLVDGPNIARLRWLGLFGASVITDEGRFDLEEHPLGEQLRDLLGEAADFETSDTFPRWSGQRWNS